MKHYELKTNEQIFFNRIVVYYHKGYQFVYQMNKMYTCTTMRGGKKHEKLCTV